LTRALSSCRRCKLDRNLRLAGAAVRLERADQGLDRARRDGVVAAAAFRLNGAKPVGPPASAERQLKAETVVGVEY
jgi:hypothetical protein